LSVQEAVALVVAAGIVRVGRVGSVVGAGVELVGGVLEQVLDLRMGELGIRLKGERGDACHVRCGHVRAGAFDVGVRAGLDLGVGGDGSIVGGVSAV